jgi:hypothetical protein
MSRLTIHTPFQSGDMISERAARRVAAHPRAAAAPAPEVTPARPVNTAPAARQPTPTPPPSQTNGARILRRWSVAELIARAAVGQPAIA